MTRFVDSAATDPGGRHYNEDAWLSRADLGLWAVADGAGGHAQGAAASRAAMASLETMPPGLSAAEILVQVRARLDAVHGALLASAAEQADDCVIATTIVVLIARGAHFACLWAGDSRAYRLHDGLLEPLTRDHSLVQELVDDGRITEAQAGTHPRRNVITRALGAGPGDLHLDKVTGRLASGDQFLLCSDGLCKTLRAADMLQLLSGNATAEGLVEAALVRRPSDNVTAVVVEVRSDEE